jgi:hypothetical protein
MKRLAIITLLALAAAGCGSSHAKQHTHVVAAAQVSAVKVNGTPQEVSAVRSVLSGMNATSAIDTVTVGDVPSDVAQALKDPPGDVWITVNYPYTNQGDQITAQWQAMQVMDGYAAASKTSGAPAAGGVTFQADGGQVQGDFSSLYTPDELSQSDTPVGQDEAAVTEVLKDAGWTQVTVTSGVAGTTELVVSGAAPSPKAYLAGSAAVLHVDKKVAWLITVRDDAGNPMGAIESFANGGTMWTAPTVAAELRQLHQQPTS